MKLLKGKNALVTGGGRGIGREVAIDFAKNGANIAVCSRTKEQLDSTVKEIEKFGVKGLAIPVDLSTGFEYSRFKAVLILARVTKNAEH